MNPYYKLGLLLAGATFALQLFWIVYFFGFFRGGFEEWKKRVNQFIERIESMFFTQVRMVQPSVPEPEAAPERPAKARSYSK